MVHGRKICSASVYMVFHQQLGSAHTVFEVKEWDGRGRRNGDSVLAAPCRLGQGPQAANGMYLWKAALTNLLRQIMRAGEAGRCGAAFVLDLEDLELAMASFFDGVEAALEGCAGADTRPLPPSGASVPCLFFFLVMLVSERQEAMAPEAEVSLI